MGARVKQLFDQFSASGLSPNEAAARAIEQVGENRFYGKSRRELERCRREGGLVEGLRGWGWLGGGGGEGFGEGVWNL